ncbi:MAG TPA: S41 family peptidase [Euzebyales bacterium]|nr:S41 family peptidase [Euzebyales bacterium]
MASEFESPRPRWRTGLPGIVIAVVLAALIGAGLFALVSSDRAAGGAISAQTAEDLAPLTELYEALNSQAVDQPDKDALINAAIDAMLEEVDDPYARYFPTDDFDDFSASLDGTFSGVGLMLEETPAGSVIVSVLEGTPAEQAGIEEGERIVSVDGRDVRDAPLEQIVTRVKGEPGTTVLLGLDGGEAGARELELTRAEFDLPTFDSETLAGGVGYIDLRQFVDGAGQRVRDAARTMVDGRVRGIILDLRNNPGGLLNEAVDVASVFVDDAEIVSVEERGGARETFGASGDAVADVPLVVLVDRTSASASEIVAGAVQDADRGVIVGETTFGKGTVQTIAQLSDGSGVKFTTARYYTPSGDSIEGVGVAPDVEVARPDGPVELPDDRQVQAALEQIADLADGGR